MASAGQPAWRTADIDNLAVDASDESASPSMGAPGGSTLEGVADGDRESSGGWDSDSDAGYASAEDWPATPVNAGRTPAGPVSPEPLRSVARRRVGPPATEAADAAATADDDDIEPDAHDGAHDDDVPVPCTLRHCMLVAVA